MSSDDVIFIVKVGTKFFGFNVMLSTLPQTGNCGYLNHIINKGYFKFEAESIEDAILKAQRERTEYGYEFVNLRGFDKTANEEEQ